MDIIVLAALLMVTALTLTWYLAYNVIEFIEYERRRQRRKRNEQQPTDELHSDQSE